MKQTGIFQRLLAALLLVALCASLLPTMALPARAADTQTVTNPTNGYRTLFNDVTIGGSPAGWSGGTWTMFESATGIDSWGAEYPVPWNHFLQYQSGSQVYTYDAVYSDIDYTTHMNLSEAGAAGAMVFRYQDDSNYYYFKLDASTNQAVIGKVVDGTDTVLSTQTYAVQTNKWYNLRVQAAGSEIVCKVNTDPFYIDVDSMNPGVEVGRVSDETFSEGKCGYWAQDSKTWFCTFAVSNTAADFTLENEYFTLTTGAYGQIKSLKMKGEAHDYDFVGNEETHRMEVGYDKWLGELLFTYQVNGQQMTASTGASQDNRVITCDGSTITVTYDAASDPSQLDGGLKDLKVVETYALIDDYVQMDIQITNTSGEAMTIQDLGMPITWNNHWQFKSPYESYLAAAANYVSYDGSYVLLEQGKGGGNKLLFTPVAETDAKFEYRKFMSKEATFYNPPEIYYIYSDAVQSEGQGYLDSTSLTLADDESKTFSFRFNKITGDYPEVGDELYAQDNLDVTVNPGMIFPKNVTAKIDIHTTQTIHSVTAKQDTNAKITSLGEVKTDHFQYEIQFAKEGRNDVVIAYGDGKESVLQFWIQGDLEQALQSRVDYLMTELRITDPSDPHCYSFKEVNNITEIPQLGGNQCNNNDYEQMYDGPAFIAEKNVYYPVQEEITAIDDYLTKLVWEKEMIHGGSYDGYLCHACCQGRCWNDAYPAADPYLCTRPFNYPRIYNTFWSMYKIADQYPDMTFYKDKTWYLEAAGKLAVTGVKLAGGMGVMGEQTVADIIAALEAEGLNALAENLMEVSQWKAGLIDANPYPFGSEFGTDSTAEEGAYFFSKMFNNVEAMEKTVDKAIAWKGKSNVWYWQCTGNRQDNDWWLFQYTVGLHGALLNDWYFNNVENPEDYWSMVYPFKYAPFVHIKTSEEQECPGKVGTVWWNYKSTEPYDWDLGFPYCESGEADISLWAGLQIASADVVRDDPAFGTTGYGCIVTDNGETLTVVPQDGLYRRLNVVGAGFQLELLTDRYTEAALPDSDTVDTLTLKLENATNTAHSGELTVRGMPVGTYLLLVDGALQAYVNVTDSDVETTVAYQINADKTHTLSLVPTVGDTLKVAVVGDETVLGEGTSDWTAHSIQAHLEDAFTAGGYEVEFFTQEGATLSSLADTAAVAAYGPNMVLILGGSNDLAGGSFESAYSAVLDSYKSLSGSPIVYAVTLPVSGAESANETIRTVAGEKQAVIIDLSKAMTKELSQLESGVLDNNGALTAARYLYNAVTAKAYAAPAKTYDPYAGISAVDYDTQTGAEISDPKKTEASAAQPYVELEAGESIGFTAVNLQDVCDQLTLQAQGNGQVELRFDSADGALVGACTVNSTDWQDAAMTDLVEAFGVHDLYLVAASGTVSLRGFTFRADPNPSYSNDFSGDLTGWTPYGGSFAIEDGQLRGSGDGKILVDGLNFSDFVMECDVTVDSSSNAWGGPVFRVTEPGAGLEAMNGYCVNFSHNGDEIMLSKHSQNWGVLRAWPYTVETGVTYHVTIVAEGATITLYIDDELVGSVTDPEPYLTGMVGLRSYGTTLYMDNLNVVGYSEGGAAILEQPQSAVKLEGENVSFSVRVDNEAADYQWQSSTDRVRWTDISGATGSTYELTSLTMEQNGTYFRCIVTVDGVETSSDAALLTVKGIPTVERVTVTPAEVTIRQGGAQTFTAAVTGENEPSQAVTWLVVGAQAEGTRFDGTGTLTVAADEPAGTLTVRAVSQENPNVSGEATVTVEARTGVAEENVTLYYTFDSAEGVTVKDYSANGYDGTMGGVITDASWSEDGFAFAGGNYVKVSNAELVSPNMTILFRVMRTADSADPFSFFWGKNQSDYAGNGIWINSTNENALFVSTDTFGKNFNTVGLSRNEFFPLNEWVEVAVTVSTDTGDFAIYRNGVKVETTALEGGVSVTVPTASYNTIGMAGYDNEFLNGFTMNKYMIFDMDLSAVEVAEVYNGKFSDMTGGQEPEPERYTIAVTQSAGGTIEPGTTTVTEGESLTFTITPDEGYTLADVLVDGESVGAVGSYTFENVTENHTITATFTEIPVEPGTYTIAVTQSEGGVIEPGTTTVTEGESPTFTITADEGYELTDVLADGKSVGAVPSYSFENVTENHTLTAVFTKTGGEVEPETYVVVVLNGVSGTGSYQAGETVTIQAGSRSGYRFAGWVTEDVVLANPNRATTSFVMPAHNVTVEAKWNKIPEGGGSHETPEEKPETKPETPVQTEFYDVASTAWYADAVEYVAEEGIMNGVSEGRFDPNGSVTRAMVWTVLARLDGENTEGGSTWYSKAQSWAMRTGVSDGTDPMGSITREQLAAMLYRFEGSPAVSGSLSAYPDAASVSDWAKDAMVWATRTGLIDGINGNLSPKTGATRAQLATMLMRFTA